MKISIIVPVFNVENYLDRCLQSLLRQGLDPQEVELILVNDGSTDSSASICLQFAEANENCLLVNQDNQGLGGARNTGLNNARGEYVCFVDADDELKDGGLSQLISLCDGSVDIIRYYSEILPPGKEEADLIAEHGEVVFAGTGNEYIVNFGLETFCWNYLYRRQYLIEHNRAFDNVINEDFRFISNVLLDNPRMLSTSYPIYNYWIRENSISTTQTWDRSRRWSYDLLDSVLMIKDRLDGLLEENPRVYEQGVKSLQGCLPLLFSRMLSSDLTQEEETAIVSKCRHASLLPLPPTGGSVKTRLSRKAVNTLARHPGLYSLARVVFCGFFLPYIKPRLNRNV